MSIYYIFNGLKMELFQSSSTNLCILQLNVPICNNNYCIHSQSLSIDNLVLP